MLLNLSIRNGPSGRRPGPVETLAPTLSATAADKGGAPTVWLSTTIPLERMGHPPTGVEGVIEIESEWTAQRRERMGLPLQVKVRGDTPTLSPKAGEKDGAPTM